MYRLMGYLVASFLFMALFVVPMINVTSTSDLQAGHYYRSYGGYYHGGYYPHNYYRYYSYPSYYHYHNYYYPGYAYAYPYNYYYDTGYPSYYWNSGPGVNFYIEGF